MEYSPLYIFKGVNPEFPFTLFISYAILLLHERGEFPMNNLTKESLSNYVVKSNDLIQKTRYDLTTQQQKIVLFAVSKIKPNDSVYQEYKITVDEICAACGLDLDRGGHYYNAIKDDIKILAERTWCKMPDGSERTLSWIGDAEILPGSGTITITFNKYMAPYLFDLREKYTQFKLRDILVFSGKYAIRFYEILRSYYTHTDIENGSERTVHFTVSQLRDILSLDEAYPRWADFNRFVIKQAIDEINLYSDDMQVSYHTKRNGGRSITDVYFLVRPPKAVEIIRSHNAKRLKYNCDTVV